jgi:hypothetical protein
MEKIILLNYTAGIFAGPRMILQISFTDLKLGNALCLNVSPTRQDLIIILKKLNFWYGSFQTIKQNYLDSGGRVFLKFS